MMYRAMFPDSFIDVEADSEEEAAEKAKGLFIAQIKAGEAEPIVWPTELEEDAE